MAETSVTICGLWKTFDTCRNSCLYTFWPLAKKHPNDLRSGQHKLVYPDRSGHGRSHQIGLSRSRCWTPSFGLAAAHMPLRSLTIDPKVTASQEHTVGCLYEPFQPFPGFGKRTTRFLETCSSSNAHQVAAMHDSNLGTKASSEDGYIRGTRANSCGLGARYWLIDCTSLAAVRYHAVLPPP